MSKVVLAPFKAVASVVGKVVGVVLGAIQPKKPSNSSAANQRLSKQLNPEDFRKIVFGETAGAVDLRFWEIHGTKNDNYSEVIAVAGHQIDGFGTFYVEDDAVPFSGNQAGGAFSGGTLLRALNTGAPGNPALSVGRGTYWDASSKFVGTAHYSLRWLYSDKKLPNGIPSRYTQIVRGALVYDPRRDSTRGGSGPMRVEDQSTWSYAQLDANGVPLGRNNALQMLWYLLGWRINGLLVCGRGVAPEDIDFPAFIQAANDAEALNNYTDMVLSTGDTHENNEGVISCDGLLGELLDAGGLWGYHVVKDDTADIAVDLLEDDVIGGDVLWDPFKTMSEQCNEVAGTYIDPASLFQAKAYPTIKDAAYLLEDNGRRRRKTQNYQAIQDPAFSQRVSRLMLNRGRFSGEFQATFNLKALRARTWSVVTLTIGRYGFTQKLFRVMSQSTTAAGIEMVLREEDPSIYSGGTVTPQPAPASFVKYDPRMEIDLDELGVTPFSVTGEAGTAIDGLLVNWQAPPGNVRRTEVQYKLVTDTYWMTATAGQADSTSLFIGPLQPGSAYVVQARHVSIHEVPGPWASVQEDTGSDTRANAGQTYYENDRPVEALRPDAPHATPGAPDGYPVGGTLDPTTGQVTGGRPAAQVIIDLDLNAENLIQSLLMGQALEELVHQRTLLNNVPIGTVVASNQTQLVDGLTSVAQTLSLLGAKSAAGDSWIIDINAVKADENTTLATRFTQLAAGSAAILQLNEVVFGPEGSTARSMLTMTNNGHVTGTIQTNDGTTGEFIVVANRFMIVDPGNGVTLPIVPFLVENGVVKMKNVEVDKLKAGAIDFEFMGARQDLNPAGGYQVLPGGFIIQWGQYRQTFGGGSVKVTFPIPFPTMVASVTATPVVNTANTPDQDMWVQLPAAGRTNTGFSVIGRAGPSGQTINGFDWMAFGR